MAAKRMKIEASDILPLADYGQVRKQRRRELIEMKKARRLEVGPHACFYFENFETMQAQVQEMLWIEGGGDEQLADELAAYNPLVPNGRELVATFMIEIDDDERRKQILATLGGIENTISLQIGDLSVNAVADVQDGVERTRADGKTSSIHFLHFPFSAEEIARFTSPDAKIILAIGHDHYAHMAVLPEATKAALAGDFA